ncbi:MAG: C4-dicarboxylate transporter DcuC, partial [Gemmataceae bacterium]
IVAGLVFWIQSSREPLELPPEVPTTTTTEPVQFWKAAVPLVPLFILFFTGPPLNIVTMPTAWLTPTPGLFATRWIGVAMLAGVVAAALAVPFKARDCAKVFFEGAGAGFTNVVSLIITANCFGKAIEEVGLAAHLGRLIEQFPTLLMPLAAAVPTGFATVSGSGMASTQSLYGFFHPVAETLGIDPAKAGAFVSIGSAAGRTMSPVAAVVLMGANLVGVPPMAIVRRVAGPLIAGLAAVVLARFLGVV